MAPSLHVLYGVYSTRMGIHTHCPAWRHETLSTACLVGDLELTGLFISRLANSLALIWEGGCWSWRPQSNFTGPRGRESLLNGCWRWPQLASRIHPTCNKAKHGRNEKGKYEVAVLKSYLLPVLCRPPGALRLIWSKDDGRESPGRAQYVLAS